MTHTILIIDDDEMALLVRRLVLEGARYVVFTATNATQAKQIFATEEINLVITDHLVTESGIGLATEFRRFSPKLPVIMLSGGRLPLDELTPPDYFLHKLDGPEEMVAKVRSAILLDER